MSTVLFLIVSASLVGMLIHAFRIVEELQKARIANKELNHTVKEQSKVINNLVEYGKDERSINEEETTRKKNLADTVDSELVRRANGLFKPNTDEQTNTTIN